MADVAELRTLVDQAAQNVARALELYREVRSHVLQQGTSFDERARGSAELLRSIGLQIDVDSARLSIRLGAKHSLCEAHRSVSGAISDVVQHVWVAASMGEHADLRETWKTVTERGDEMQQAARLFTQEAARTIGSSLRSSSTEADIADAPENRLRSMVEQDESPQRGAYDLRKGAAAHSSIVGSVGGFVVTAVVLVFTIAHDDAQATPARMALVAGLLVLALIGCLLGAFSLAAISGETTLTPNLPAAGMYVGTGIVISIVAILAAFEGLAAIYLPQSKILFAGISAAGAIAGLILNGLGVVDAWANHPGAVEWIRSRSHANTWGVRLGLIAAVPVALAFALYAADVRIEWSTAATNYLVGVGILAVTGASLLGTVRTVHADDGRSRGIRREEAIGIQLVASVYLAILLVSLP
jgi:hypothetical protein